MDVFLAWLGRAAGVLAVLMVVPLAFVFGPTLLALFGVIPWEASQLPWVQAQPFLVPYVAVWVILAVLFAIGRAADDRLAKRQRTRH